MPPPTRLKIAEIPAYVEKTHGLKISKQTAYNWMNKGMRDETLQFITVPGKRNSKHPNVRVTTTEWVDDFCNRTGIVGQA